MSESCVSTKVLLLEGIQGYHFLGWEIVRLPHALDEDQLIAHLKGVTVLGIRSATKVTRRVLEHSSLLAIGCFCIGTNQVDLEAATKLGIAVFHSPFANTRSVAELCIAQMVCLSRQSGDRNIEMHNNTWNKTSQGCHEVRGKQVGIVGYGHVGSQVGILAEALGMKVVYYDIRNLLPYGRNRPVEWNVLLSTSDFVTFHVPLTSQTKAMLNRDALLLVKQGAYILNTSRGEVVDMSALRESLPRLGGIYLDVFPQEPTKNGPYLPPITGPNVILSPHIGGSTEEAQGNINKDISAKLVNYITQGQTLDCLTLPNLPGISSGVAYIHHNVPRALLTLHQHLSDHNILSETLATQGDVGYCLMTLDRLPTVPLPGMRVLSQY